jgi:hypothetical protein
MSFETPTIEANVEVAKDNILRMHLPKQMLKELETTFSCMISLDGVLAFFLPILPNP